jgi:Resolvase, N terminal domain
VEAGCSKLFIETISTRRDQRPELEKALEYARRGDELVITRLARAARNVREIKDLAAHLEKRGIDFVVLKQQIDTSTATGRFFFHVMPFGSGYPQRLPADEDRDLPSVEDLLDLPHVLKAVRRTRKAHFTTRSGHDLRWRHDDVRALVGPLAAGRPVPVTCLDQAAVHAAGQPLLPEGEPRPYRGRDAGHQGSWLLSPLAFSGLFLAASSTSQTSLQGIAFVDRGTGPPTDLDGIARRAASPGQAGLDGKPYHYDQHVEPDHLRITPRSPTACIVASAWWANGTPGTAIFTLLAGDLADARPATTLLAHLTHPCGMLAGVDWVLPVQHGAGPWSSPWLELPEPESVLTIISAGGHEHRKG